MSFNDWNYYYDFSREQTIAPWKTESRDGSIFIISSQIRCQEEDDYVILIPFPKQLDCDISVTPVFLDLEVSGQRFSFKTDMQSPYVFPQCARKGCRVHLGAGTHIVRIRLSFSGGEDLSPWLKVNLIKDLPPAPAVKDFDAVFDVPQQPLPSPCRKDPDLAGYTPGAGCTEAPGRFGFTKGDGVLDCAMPALGLIDKMYLCGHPKYKKPFRWSYSTLPENALPRGSFHPAVELLQDDSVEVNPMGVTWTTRYNGKKFSCSYSLGTAGILTESEEDHLRLSSLEFAGNYQYVIVPEKQGCRIMSLDQAEKGFGMAENFLVFFGSTEFPDLPLLAVLDRSPSRLEIRRNPRTGRLTEIIFHGIHRMVTATPFGIESPEPISPADSGLLKDLIRRCRFWSHAFMAFPVRCREYFKINENEERVHIIQQFSYRYLTDEWNTEPLELAPLPPVTSISGAAVTEDTEDFRFPTKFGWLKGAFGNTSSYTIPTMPTRRKYPFRDPAHDEPEKLLRQCMGAFFQFAEQFPDTIQGYPFAGALMEPFAWASSMFLFMQEEDREKICKYAEERLKAACDPDRQYNYPVIQWGDLMKPTMDDEQVKRLYHDPEMKHKKLWNWYSRVEPFTHADYTICYLNLSLIANNVIKTGSKEEIAGMKIPLIENDWGVGLTFYYMNLCALASGDFSPIRKNWALIKSVYRFFDRMHDWACMGTGYSDNGIVWVEGANYGAFTGYINMAEAVGDEAERKRAVYFAAKQLTLRMALIRASMHYFNHIFQVPEWYIVRSFHEESNPSYQFLNVPNTFIKDRYRPCGIYKFTTEGMYPEIFDAFRKYCPDDLNRILDHLHDIFRSETDNPVFRDQEYGWTPMEQVGCMLINDSLDPSVPVRQAADEIEFAERNGLLMKKWRGIHIFCRRLPELYFKAQLLAWNNMKNHPVWLEHWENVRIEDAVLQGSSAVVRYRIAPAGKAVFRFGCRKKPVRVTVNGKSVEFTMTGPETFRVETGSDGPMQLFFS